MNHSISSSHTTFEFQTFSSVWNSTRWDPTSHLITSILKKQIYMHIWNAYAILRLETVEKEIQFIYLRRNNIYNFFVHNLFPLYPTRIFSCLLQSTLFG